MAKTFDMIYDRLDEMERRIMTTSDVFMNVRQTAEYLGFRPSYVYKLSHYRIIPFYKPTRKKLFFKKSDIDTWIMSKKKNSISEVKVEAQKYLRLYNRRRNNFV